MCVELTAFRVSGYKGKPQSPCMRYCSGAPLGGRVISSSIWCLLESPFECAAYVASLAKLLVGLKPSSVFVGSGRGHCQTLCVTGIGQPNYSYHAVHCSCLYLLDL